MLDFVDTYIQPQFMAMLLAALAAFATVLTIALPVLFIVILGPAMLQVLKMT